MKTIFFSICVTFVCSADAQYGPGGRYLTPQPDYGALAAQREEQLQEQRDASATALYRQQQQIAAQQAEIAKILSKDPWRRLDNTTNYIGSAGDPTAATELSKLNQK